MIASGILIYWPNVVYRIGWGDFTLVKMTLAQATWQKLHVNNRLALGLAWHFFFMWFFAINGLLYVIYTIVSGEWHYLVPRRESFAEAVQVVLHDLRIRK